MRFLKGESGQMLVLTAVCATVLMGFMALAIDVGLLFRARRNAQIVADAAATAGALDYKFNGSVTSAKAAAATAATANGITNGTAGAVVTVSMPPADGPNAGNANYIEAQVSQPNATFFMAVFKKSAVTVAARAVAGGGAGAGCVWALAKIGDDFSISGSGSISVPGCDIFDNSDSSNALSLSGSGSLSAKSIGIVGSYSDTGSGTISPHPTDGIAPVSDPLSSLTAPTVSTSGCAAAQSFSDSSNHTLTPGCYDGISSSGSGTITLGAGNYTINGAFSDTGSGALILGAGQYNVTGNLSFTGAGAVTGTNVSFYTEGTTQVTGSGSITLSAPTSGSYDGLLFFQARSDTNPISITGSSSLNLQGIVYAPSAALTFSGSGGSTMYTDLIVDSVSFPGSTSFQNYAVINGSSVLGKIGLVE